MRPRESWLALILLSLTIGSMVLEPQLGWRLRALFTSGWHHPLSEAEILRAENTRLKAELAVLESVARQLPMARDDYLTALVYARYPFNFKNELLIHAGNRDGIKKGRAAVFNGVFVGRVKEVFEETARVQTVFDPRVQFSVRIGEHSVPALLRGGSPPSLALIPLEVEIQEGDAVYSTAEDIPYGLPLGVLGMVSPSRDRLWKEAVLETNYDMSAVVVLRIAK